MVVKSDDPKSPPRNDSKESETMSESRKEAGQEEWGRRLIPRIADQIGESNPDRLFAYIPKSADLDDGLRTVTVKELVTAADSMAWWIEKEYGRSESFDTIAFMGASDITYAIMFHAVVKTGYKLFVPSVRNSTTMNLSLLEDTNCNIFLYTENMKDKIEDIQQQNEGLRTAQVPPLDELLKRQAEHYPFGKTFDDAVNDPILIAHTSGSTGRPKPITLTHGAIAVYDGHRNLPKIKGRINQTYALWDFEGDETGAFFSGFPPFHGAGITNMAFLTIFYPAAVVLTPPDRPATGSMVAQIMRQMKLRAIFAAPSILEQIAKDEKGLEMLADLDWAMFTGGPLAPSAGDKITKVTTLCQIYGQTETGVISALVPKPEDWAWFEFHPAYGHDMELVGEEQYEMVINMDPSKAWMRSINHTFPDVKLWRLKDVFTKHPSKENLWQFQGRTDDIMVLGNGEKLNPVPMESVIQGHPKISGALMVGQGQNHPALIVEAQDKMKDEKDKTHLTEEIMPQVKLANEQGPSHAKILQSHIIVTDSEKPFQRTGKGTVVRKGTTDDFDEEIKSIFNSDDVLQRHDLPKLEKTDEDEIIRDFVRKSMAIVFTKKIEDSADFFSKGMDSLQAMELCAVIRSGVHPHLDDKESSWPTVQVLYSHSTVERLTQAVRSKLDGSADEDDAGSEEAMKTMVERYTQHLPQPHSSQTEASESNEFTVLLTGSTGSFGTVLLEALLDDKKISRILCLNRSDDAQKRHKTAFAERGLEKQYNLDDIEGKPSKVSFLQADFSDPHLGLSDEDYMMLLESTSAIVHNAWKVDFNHSLSTFEPHVAGIRNFIDFAAASPQHPRLFFVSSIASVNNWSADTPVPEDPMQDYDVASKMGYGESKHVAERIMQAAVTSGSVKASILRVGQIAGRILKDKKQEAGKWNDTEWFPSLVKSSGTLGALPDRIARVDWTPADLLARTIVDIVHADVEEKRDGLGIYQLINPKAGNWDELRATICEYFNRKGDQEKKMETIPLADWVARLWDGDVGGGREGMERLPAMKLLEYFEGMEKELRVEEAEKTFETERAKGVSRAFGELEGVSSSWMGIWLEQWGY